MNRYLIVLLFAAASSPALAQQQQTFVPYTISHDDHLKIMGYLGDQPAKFSVPLISALSSLQQKALADQAKADKPKE